MQEPIATEEAVKEKGDLASWEREDDIGNIFPLGLEAHQTDGFQPVCAWIAEVGAASPTRNAAHLSIRIPVGLQVRERSRHGVTKIAPHVGMHIRVIGNILGNTALREQVGEYLDISITELGVPEDRHSARHCDAISLAKLLQRHP